MRGGLFTSLKSTLLDVLAHPNCLIRKNPTTGVCGDCVGSCFCLVDERLLQVAFQSQGGCDYRLAGMYAGSFCSSAVPAGHLRLRAHFSPSCERLFLDVSQKQHWEKKKTPHHTITKNIPSKFLLKQLLDLVITLRTRVMQKRSVPGGGKKITAILKFRLCVPKAAISGCRIFTPDHKTGGPAHGAHDVTRARRRQRAAGPSECLARTPLGGSRGNTYS